MSDELRIDPKYRDGLALIWSIDRGIRLKHCRWKLMLDQREIAEKLGVRQQVVSRIENGRSIGAEISVRKLVVALNERFFLYILNGTGAASFGDVNRLQRQYEDYRFRIHRANRTQKITGQEQAILNAHEKRVIGEPEESSETDKGDYVARRK